ncbi:MAG: threonine ammonia-lyase [Pseudomonadales bacterium]|nr:threonine ammonia-lyase [Pseudomonadales bacterium]
MSTLSADSIRDAYTRIAPHIIKTPLTRSATFSSICGCETLFKLENLQMTGSFKERGAINRLLALTEDERRHGVIAASAGNHAQAVAYHAGRLGISAKVVMPRYSPLVKIRSTEHWGAEVILHGNNFDEAYQYSQELAATESRVYLHPFADELVIEGQGTIGLEVLESEAGRDIDVILVPVGGGGLIAGIATYVKAVRPDIRIVGVEESTCNSMARSHDAGHVVEIAPEPVIADGIAVRKVAANNLEVVNRLVDDLVSVSSDEIANGIMLMLEIEKIVVEGAAATTIAALLNKRVPDVADRRVLSVISGGNIDVNLLSKIINRGLAFDGRVVKIDSVIPDKPGALEKVLGIFRESGANVLEVHHHRFSGEAPIGQVEISITVETRNQEHIQEIRELLLLRGYGGPVRAPQR